MVGGGGDVIPCPLALIPLRIVARRPLRGPPSSPPSPSRASPSPRAVARLPLPASCASSYKARGHLCTHHLNRMRLRPQLQHMRMRHPAPARNARAPAATPPIFRVPWLSRGSGCGTCYERGAEPWARPAGPRRSRCTFAPPHLAAAAAAPCPGSRPGSRRRARVARGTAGTCDGRPGWR